jgi:5'-methylthioadenosine phosphorylase
MKAIIAGTSLLSSNVFDGWQATHCTTPYGPVQLRIRDGFAFLQRHGDPPKPPHAINHRANIEALHLNGVTGVLSINSAGSLKQDIVPGTLLIPEDFFSPWSVATFWDNEVRYMVPRMDESLQEDLRALCLKIGLAVRSGGVYVQTIGPRLETRSEIRMLQQFGDVVGMTMASEVTLALEKGIPYVSLCSVDNYANGVIATPLTMDELYTNVELNRAAIVKVLNAYLSGTDS